MKKFILVLWAMCAFIFIQPAQAVVELGGGDDGGGGGCNGTTLYVPECYPTIQAAVDVAQNGYTVLVGPGVYQGVGNRDIDTRGKLLNIHSTAGAQLTIIDIQGSASDPHRGFFILGGNVRIRGFTIQNGYVADDGGAIKVLAPVPFNPTYLSVRECIFMNNHANYGGAVSVDNNAQVVFRRSIIKNNIALSNGGGIWTGIGTSLDITNTLLVKNFAQDAGGALQLDGHSASMIRCTLSGNTAASGGGFGIGPRLIIMAVSDSIIWGNSEPEFDVHGSLNFFHSIVHNYPCRTNCIDSDPKFVNPSAGDYHLRDFSPAIDTSSSSTVEDGYDLVTDLDRLPRFDDINVLNTGPNGGFGDLGVYERQTDSQAAPVKYVPAPTPTNKRAVVN